jgi:hypothetical protein
MRCYCSVCGTKKTVRPKDLKDSRLTPEQYVCKNCYMKKMNLKNTGPQKTLNKIKDMGKDYQHIHIGCIARRD